MLINLGKIQPNPRGDWNSESTYTYLDIVRYANSSYICINNTAEIKNEIPTDSPNYCLIVKDGAELLLRKTETTIEWSRQGENDWHILLNLADIRGDQGIEGEIGARGPEGAQGPRGFTGLQGPQGIQGIKGDQGIRGEKGEKGDTAPNTIFQYSVDGTTWTTTATGAQWYRQSGDNGTTWSEAIVIGTTAYADGKISQTITEDVEDKAPSEGAVFDALALKADADDVAQLALQLGNPLLALENQNTLAEAILQENLLINNIYDRLEGGIYAAI